MLLDLADACRASGLPVIEVDGWQTRGALDKAGRPRALDRVAGIICHHTATPASLKGDYPSLAVVRDGRAGVSGPLAQVGLGRSGAVYVVAAGKANHAGVGAWPGLVGAVDTIGVEAESPGDGSWTAAQLDAYPWVCRSLARHYGVPARMVIAHREWALPRGRKPDPVGIDMTRLRAFVASAPTPTQPEEKDMTPEQALQLARVENAVNALVNVAERPLQAEARLAAKLEAVGAALVAQLSPLGPVVVGDSEITAAVEAALRRVLGSLD
jgi:hypothetical protein